MCQERKNCDVWDVTYELLTMNLEEWTVEYELRSVTTCMNAG